MLKNLSNRVEKNLRNGLVRCFIKGELDSQRRKVICQSQILGGREGFGICSRDFLSSAPSTPCHFCTFLRNDRDVY